MIREFFKPTNLKQAMELKERHNESVTWFGNGVFINNHNYKFNYEKAISLKNLGINCIERDSSGETSRLTIGAMVALQEIIDHNFVPSILKKTAAFEPSRLIRNMKTVGADISIGALNSCLLPSLIALSAQVQTNESSLIPIQEYIESNQNQLILQVIIPDTDVKCKAKKIALQSNSPAIVTTAVSLKYDQENKIKNIIIAIGAMGKNLIRLEKIESLILKGTLEITDINSIENAVSEQLNPISDIHGSSEYKKYIAGVIVANCIKKLVTIHN